MWSKEVKLHKNFKSKDRKCVSVIPLHLNNPKNNGYKNCRPRFSKLISDLGCLSFQSFSTHLLRQLIFKPLHHTWNLTEKFSQLWKFCPSVIHSDIVMLFHIIFVSLLNMHFEDCQHPVRLWELLLVWRQCKNSLCCHCPVHHCCPVMPLTIFCCGVLHLLLKQLVLASVW